MLDLGNSNYREKLREQEVKRKKQPDGSKKKSNLPNCRRIIRAPARWQIIAVQRGYNNHKTLKPHSHIYNNGHKECNQQVAPHFPKPEYLWKQHVAAHHQVIGPAVWTENISAVLEK